MPIGSFLLPFARRRRGIQFVLFGADGGRCWDPRNSLYDSRLGGVDDGHHARREHDIT